MSEPGYYCITDKRIVLADATDVIVGLPDGQEERLWADRWDHLDGVTLVVYRDGEPLQTYARGEWASCRHAEGVYEVWP